MKQRFLRELSIFKKLSRNAQLLLVSFGLFEFIYPVTGIFINAFLLRQTNDLRALALYNSGIYIGLPVTFWINGWMLKRGISLRLLFAGGLILRGLMASLIYLIAPSNLVVLFLFGLLLSLPIGWYWGNRNFVTLAATQDDNRNYFTSLEMIFATLGSIVTPFLVGWYLVLGERFQLYTVSQAYNWLNIVLAGLIFVPAWVIFKTTFVNPQQFKLSISHISPSWLMVRAIEAFRGANDGFKFFIPTMIIFTLLGQENVLGTLQSASALIGAVVLYVIGRKSNPRHRLILLMLTIAILIVLSFQFAVFYTPLAAVIFLVVFDPLRQVEWVSINPMIMKVIDDEEGGDPTNNYAYVIDRELFLNVGRITGTVILFGLLSITTRQNTLRILPLLAALLQLGEVWAAKKLVRTRLA